MVQSPYISLYGYLPYKIKFFLKASLKILKLALVLTFKH